MLRAPGRGTIPARGGSSRSVKAVEAADTEVVCVTSPSEDQYRGALLGLALGDALGAPYEGGLLERTLWRFMGKTRDGLCRFTDDTQMSIDLATSLLCCGDVDQADLAGRFSSSHRWDRGYGPGAARVLRRISNGMPWRDAARSVYPSGSFGNGGAMRAPVIGLFHCGTPDRVAPAARLAAEVTHAHPLGIEGAVLIAEATCAALERVDGRLLLSKAFTTAGSVDYTSRLGVALGWFDAEARATAQEVRRNLGMGITAPESCVTALYLAARFFDSPFEALLAFTIQAGGDVDTVAAMAGALWGARNGYSRLPQDRIATLEDAGPLRDLADRLHARVRGAG